MLFADGVQSLDNLECDVVGVWHSLWMCSTVTACSMCGST